MADEPNTLLARSNDGSRRGLGEQSPRGGNPGQLVNSLEELRVASTFFVLLYHAALTYMATPLRLTTWVAYDVSRHVGFDIFIYWVNGFAMPVFFLAAGISAPVACEARGPRVYVTHRIHRLLRPLLFGCLTMVPCCYLLWGYGLMVTGRCDLNDILRWDFSPQIRPYLYGLGHLWFLEYLFLVSLLWCGGWTLCRALGRGPQPSQTESGWVQRMLASSWRPLLFAIPTGLIFCIDSDTMLRVDNKIVPDVFRSLHYAWFFAVGGWISKLHEPKQRLIPLSRLYAVLALAAFALMSPLLLRHAAMPLDGWSRFAFCILAALFPWLFVFGGLGLLLRMVRGRGAVMRFLSEASFWIYLVHVPIVALMQLLLLRLSWPAPVKFLIVSAVAIVLSLLSYESIVRRSLVGEIVNGARKRSPKTGWLRREFGWIATLGVMVILASWGAWSYRVFFWGNNFYAEVPGQLYRSARLSTEQLDDLISREGLRTVVTFTSGSDRHPWFVAQRRVCESRHVTIHAVNLSSNQVPSRKMLIRLVDLLHQCPRPVLVQGYRGIDHCGFASAVVQLLRGVPPHVALRQFDPKYGQFRGPQHSPLGLTLLAYQDWLDVHHWPHNAERFRSWAAGEYLVSSFPTPPGEPRTPGGLIARGAHGPVTRR